MKKSIFLAALAALTIVACNKNEKSSSDAAGTEETLSQPANQDSIDNAHGHSHDPADAAPADEAAHGHSHDAPTVNQDSIDSAHGHKH
jgi:ABC-type enterochelin transport system substrate-binding protein